MLDIGISLHFGAASWGGFYGPLTLVKGRRAGSTSARGRTCDNGHCGVVQGRRFRKGNIKQASRSSKVDEAKLNAVNGIRRSCFFSSAQRSRLRLCHLIPTAPPHVRVEHVTIHWPFDGGSSREPISSPWVITLHGRPSSIFDFSPSTSLLGRPRARGKAAVPSSVSSIVLGTV